MNKNKLIVCAELGINHNGDMNLCHEMIRQAAINGADLAKFQLYEPTILFKDEPQLIQEAQRCQFTHDEFKRVLDWCDEEDIKPFFSVFDETRLKWTEDAGMDSYKVASRTTARDPEFCKILNDLNKPLYVSLGMTNFDNKIIDLFGNDNRNIKYLYCVAKYPAEYNDYKFQPKVYDQYDLNNYYGISDHTLGIETSLVAIGRGARFVEKHFTLSKTMEGSDHKCSITPDELHDLVKYGKLMIKTQ